MADSDKKLSLQIVLDLIGEGKAEEARKKLEELKGGSADLSKEMGVVNVSGADVEKILGKAGEKAELSGLSMRRLAHAMGSEIPGGAALMEAGFEASHSGMLSASFLLLGGIEMLRVSIEKLNKEKQESKKISDALADADRATTKVIDVQREALEHADVAQAEFFHNFLHNAHDAYEAEAKLYEARLKASFENANDQDSTRKRISDRAVDEMEQAGILSHAAAVKAKEQLDLEYEARKLARQHAQDVAEEGELARQQANKGIAEHVDSGKEQDAEKQYEAAAQAKAANDAKMEEARRKIQNGEDAKKSLRDTGVTDDTVQQLNDFVTKYGGDDSASLAEKFHFAAMKNLGAGAGSLEANRIIKLFGSQGDRNLALYEGANIDIASGKSDLARGQKKEAGLDIGEGNAKSDVDYYRGRVEKDRDAEADLGDKLQSTQAVNRIKEAGARADFGLDAAAHMLEGHATNVNNFMQQVNRLADSMSQMSPQAVAELARRVDALEAQFGSHANGGYR
jgi:hypothetical protein